MSREVNLQPFQFHPTRFQSPSAWTSSRPGQRCHLLFISSVIRRPEKVLYIVMLPHLGDISKIEVQVKDQYELKVNKSKKSVRIRNCNHLCFLIHLFLQENLKLLHFQANRVQRLSGPFFIPLIPAPNVCLRVAAGFPQYHSSSGLV